MHKITRRADHGPISVMDEIEGNFDTETRDSLQCRTFNWEGFVPPEHRPLMFCRLNPTDAEALRYLEQRVWAGDHMDIKMSNAALAELLGVSVQTVKTTIKKLALLGFIGICEKRLAPAGKFSHWSTVRFLRVHSIGWFYQWDFSGERTVAFKNDVRPDREEILLGEGISTAAVGKIHPKYLVKEPMRLPNPDLGGKADIIQPAFSQNPFTRAMQALDWADKGWFDIAAKEEATRLIGEAAYGDRRATLIVGWKDDFVDRRPNGTVSN